MFTVNNPTLGSATYINKVIYKTQPHMSADNHFSGEHVLDYAGEMAMVSPSLRDAIDFLMDSRDIFTTPRN